LVVGGDEGRYGQVDEDVQTLGESSECVRVMRVKTRLGAIFG
jgi:hypothetical protein